VISAGCRRDKTVLARHGTEEEEEADDVGSLGVTVLFGRGESAALRVW
jgi:hypothetical protein